MTRHACRRCGLESPSHGHWADRHPAATVALGVPSVLFTLGAISAHPYVLIPLIVVAAVAWINQRQRQRAAIAARADYEYRELMAAQARDVQIYSARGQRQRRPRGADHWSVTEPIRGIRGRNVGCRS